MERLNAPGGFLKGALLARPAIENALQTGAPSFKNAFGGHMPLLALSNASNAFGVAAPLKVFTAHVASTESSHGWSIYAMKVVFRVGWSLSLSTVTFSMLNPCCLSAPSNCSVGLAPTETACGVLLRTGYRNQCVCFLRPFHFLFIIFGPVETPPAANSWYIMRESNELM